tara:strand:- start:184 stop:1059 length:876 start_codon:yes stop_codon:yes gene_type:complete
MYTCICCNYSTPHQSNYKRHIVTSKHKKIIEEFQKQKTINTNSLMLIITRLEESNIRLEESNTRLEESNIRLEESNTRLEESNTRLEESNKVLQSNYINLQKRISTLEKSIANKKHIGTIGTINNYNTTVTNQVNIQIENFGNESISHIKDKQKRDILNSPNMALRSLLEYVHFNANKPEFQNIKWTNMQKPLILTKRRDGVNGWSLDNKDETLEELTRNLVNFMDEIRDEYDGIFNNRTNSEKINDLIQIMNTADENLSNTEKKYKKQVINKLGIHLYQCSKAQKYQITT